jgi:hypothetical protein
VKPKFNPDMSLYRIIFTMTPRTSSYVCTVTVLEFAFLLMFYTIPAGFPKPVPSLFSKQEARRNFIREVPNLVVFEIAVVRSC